MSSGMHVDNPLDGVMEACSEAGIDALCLPHALDSDAMVALGKLGDEREIARGERLFRQGSGLHALYVIKDGVLKTVMLDCEGREQVIGFHFPGDLVGLDALRSGEHVCVGIAVVKSQVGVIPMHRLKAQLRDDKSLNQALLMLASKLLVEHEQLLMLVNQRSSIERVAVLLFSLACRLGGCGRVATELSLPMSRRDIANHLGLAMETVSRAIHALQSEGVISGYGKNMKILAPMRLRQWAMLGDDR